jgi:hypothetical protein
MVAPSRVEPRARARNSGRCLLVRHA